LRRWKWGKHLGYGKPVNLFAVSFHHFRKLIPVHFGTAADMGFPGSSCWFGVWREPGSDQPQQAVLESLGPVLDSISVFLFQDRNEGINVGAGGCPWKFSRSFVISGDSFAEGTGKIV
jgi:hypothetical protein